MGTVWRRLNSLGYIKELNTPMVYVDVGAFHLIKYSNTLLFHKNGWHGINVDANPDTIQLFNSYMPNDINLHCAVGRDEKEANFSVYNSTGVCATGRLTEKSYSTCSILGESEIRNIAVKVRTLSNMLEGANFRGKKIRLLNIDVEGHELEVLMSNCWDRFRLVLIAVEQHPGDTTSISGFLAEKKLHFSWKVLDHVHLYGQSIHAMMVCLVR
ncbi:FkbM family methyltransferase [Prosthecobacter fusiformis]|uniref:FkbM family methyltransferase n=2 Tax=Prosthecobacter fusiformis TaxID=48464 RepID=A0A4V3FFM7_9BACT|nr:FkbM family methyltransferase [Prosthecobacter fusiformis]